MLHKLHISNFFSDKLSESEKLNFANNVNVSLETSESNNIKRYYLDYVLSANQRKCFRDMEYLLKNLNSEWAIKSKFVLFSGLNSSV